MKKMLINALHPEEIRVAVVNGGILEELYIQSALKEQIRGNIYKGRISRIEPSLNAVFVDYGRDRHGLLPLNDINWRFIPNIKPGEGSLSLLRKGMEIPVQANREEKNAKGALLTQNISIPGRYMVLLPRQDLSGISRKIEDEAQRKRLKDIISQLAPPQDMGLIVRTAGMDRTKGELQKDLAYLLRLWKSIEEDLASAPCPSLIYREGDIIIRSIRDYFTADISEVLIDSEETYRRAVVFMKSVMPRHKDLIRHYRQNKPLFTKYQLEQQIQNIYSKKVRLPSGGTLVIEPTEAMVVIDVNSAQSTAGKDIENTALDTNLEATAEIARQLVLRDIGGLVVIDFIDMRPRENMRKVEKALKEALKNDRAHLVVGRISQFGILEISRERLSATLLEKSYVSCPFCEGAGVVRSKESSALMALREIQFHLNRSHPVALSVELCPDVALYLLNSQKNYLLALEQDFSVKIDIVSVQDLKRGQVRISIPEQQK